MRCICKVFSPNQRINKPSIEKIIIIINTFADAGPPRAGSRARRSTIHPIARPALLKPHNFLHFRIITTDFYQNFFNFYFLLEYWGNRCAESTRKQGFEVWEQPSPALLDVPVLSGFHVTKEVWRSDSCGSRLQTNWSISAVSESILKSCGAKLDVSKLFFRLPSRKQRSRVVLG